MRQALVDLVRSNVAQRVNMPEGAWQTVASTFSPRTLARREVLLRQGDVCSFIAFLARGCLRFYYTTERGDMTGHIFLENAWVSDYYSFLTCTPSLQTIEALEDSELLTLNKADVESLYRAIPAWQEFGRKIAEEIYICAHRRSASLLFETPQRRYQNLVADRPGIVRRLPQHIIASYLGMTPETLSRIKKRLDLNQ